MGTTPSEQQPSAHAGAAPSTQAAPAEADRLLDLVYELDALRAELAMQAETERHLRLELAAERQRHFDHYQVAPVGYLDVDRDLTIREANLTVCALVGVERRSLVSQRLGDLFIPGSIDELRRCAEVVLGDGSAMRLADPLTTESGRSLQAVLSRVDHHLLVTLFESPPSRAAESKLKARELELQAILDALDSGVATIDQNGTILSCNRRMAALFGGSPEGLMGTPLVRLVPGVGRGPRPGHYELTAHAGRRRFPVEVSVSALEGPSSDLVVEISDVSQRQREQRERNEALLRFNQIAERIADAFYVTVASSGESLYVSPAFIEIYGRPMVAHGSEPWPRLRWVHPDDRGRVREAVEGLWAGGTFDIEYRVVRPSGEERRVHDRAFMLADQRSVTGILQDVTQQRAVEEELRQSQRLEAMGTLASGVAHDFNNLLMGLGGCVQLALMRLDDEHPSRGYLQRGADAILRGANLTRQILRIGETRRPPEGTISPDDAILSMEDLVRSLLGDSVRLVLQLRAQGQHIAAEAADIERILLNLATNARDAMPKGGCLTVTTELQNGRIVVAVRDTGTGMSPQVRARVFEPFFTTKGVGKGTGLGLSTVFALVRRLEGTVGLDSEPGRGATFRMAFPAHEPAAELRAFDSTRPPPAVATVLVVDDDPLVRLTVENHLEAMGYVVLVASTTDEAIEVCEDPNIKIDIMVTDVMMPGMLGPELSEALQKRNKRLPVVYMSAHPREELVRQGHITPDDHLLAKPFDAMELSAELTQTLGEAQDARELAKFRIFVVDDNRDIAEGLEEILTFEGHTVQVATNAADALTRAPEFRPEVVLCDVALGDGVNGFELTKILRLDPRLCDSTFIALTGFQSSECREQAREAGMKKILTKPVDAAKLVQLLKKLVR